MMRMKRSIEYRTSCIKGFMILIITMSLAVSCQEEIAFEDEWGDPKLVLNAIIEEGEPIVAHLSRSKQVTDLSGLSLNIINGSISLYAEGIKISDLTHTENGLYVSGIPAVTGVTYELLAIAPNYELIKGQSTVAIPTQINGIDSVGVQTDQWQGEQIVLNVKFSDVAGVDNYYRLSAYYMDSIEMYNPQSETYELVYDRRSVNLYASEVGGDIYQFNNALNVSDALFDGKEYQLKVNMDSWSLPANKPVQVYFELGSQDKHLFYYTKAVMLQEQSQDMSIFAEPVAMYNNIEGGVGIVGSISHSSKSLQLHLEYEYEEF